MEEVLDLYAMPYDPDCPVLCKPGRPFPLRPNTQSVLIMNTKGRACQYFHLHGTTRELA
jgi:hypothetical protein